MKRITEKRERQGSFTVAMALLGSLIGAGFLSGQELCQFFGIHGSWLFAAVTLSMTVMGLIGAVMLRLAMDTGEGRMDKIVVFFDCQPLRVSIAVLEILFVFMIYLVGISAFGSLLDQMFGVSAAVGGALFTVLVFFLSLFGIKGLLRVFSLVIPTLVVLTVLISLVAMARAEGFAFPTGAPQGAVSGIWPLDGMSYAAFALFCMLPVLVPFGASMHPKKRPVSRGICVGMLLFTALALVILLAIATDPEVRESALPMIELATRQSVVFGVVYGFLLMCAIFSATLSAAASISEYFARTFASKKRFLIPVMAFVSLAAFALGLFGFENLVSVLFPIFGYLGTLPIMLLLIHAWRFYRSKRKNGVNT
ncbi:MAG: hypothetical protein IKC75_01995 [Clostridia bacterium]|nr:hypothetical protein [Clostridia bacterium]